MQAKLIDGLEIVTLDSDFEAEFSHEIYCHGHPSEFSKFVVNCWERDIEHATSVWAGSSLFYGESYAGVARMSEAVPAAAARMSQFIRRELCDDWTSICAYIVETLGVEPSEIVSVKAQ